MGVLGAAVLLFFIASGNTAGTVVAALSSIAASVLFTTKDNNNISVIDQAGYKFASHGRQVNLYWISRSSYRDITAGS